MLRMGFEVLLQKMSVKRTSPLAKESIGAF
jgi:hypothetical protein